MSISLPSVSIIMPTLNSIRTLRESLESIYNQDYPKELIELIIIDGGSSDATLAVATEFNARVINRPDKRDNPESRKALGIAEAKNELVALIDSDNILPHKLWLRNLIEPLVKNPDIVATQPLRYLYDRSFSLLNRYFALFGVNDPIAYYFNKRDRQSWAESGWAMFGEARDSGNYYLVTFNKENVPTLGANGYIARRQVLLKARVSPDEFFHIDVNFDLISLGYNKYGIVKDSIIHLTGDNLFSFLRKRIRFMEVYHQKDYTLRRWKLYEPRDTLKLLVFAVYSATFLRPLFDSLKGFLKVRDLAWFLHPLMCFVILVAYSLTTIQKWLIR